MMGQSLATTRPCTVAVIGLESSGKSCLLEHLQPRLEDEVAKGRIFCIQPTTGMQLHRFRRIYTEWRIFDMSGFGKYRSLWESYYSIADGLVFVVDRTNLDVLGCVKSEFHRMLEHLDSRQKPLLILLTKADDESNPEYLTVPRLELLLNLEGVRTSHALRVQAVSGFTGAGVVECFEWLADACVKRVASN